MLDGTMIDKDLLKNKIFEYASRQYAELDAGERITMEMRVALLDTGPLSSYSAELVKAIVTDITLHADKKRNSYPEKRPAGQKGAIGWSA